ncbi:DNase I-like protein [Periconia macrospinosa]|uniref:DNase I-like protein n=1 Tax=Periconia macrospinosa TaxID=97972 RepID=A0A2V1D1I9_9PLEO|nr:DNase I-like protein [Periconia macrospinosa]
MTPRGTASLRNPWNTPKARPISMVACSSPPSPSSSPPKLTIISPKSPPRPSDSHIHSPLPSRSFPHSALDSPAQSTFPGGANGHGNGNGAKNFRIPTRVTTPAVESKPFLSASQNASPSGDPRKSGLFDRHAASAPPVPPPINRAGKPKIPSKPASIEVSARTTLAPEQEEIVDRVSPFSTPPSSHDGSPRREEMDTGHARTRSGIPREKGSYFPPPPLHHAVADRIPATDPRGSISSQPVKIAAAPPPKQLPPRNRPEDQPPALPARRERDNVDLRKSMVIQRPIPPEPPVRRSMDTFRPSSLAVDRLMQPPRRTSTINVMTGASATKSLEPPKPPPPRNSGEFRRSTDAARPHPAPAQVQQPYSYDSDDADGASEQPGPVLTDYPDASQANRRPPIFKEGVNMIPTGYETKLFAICGEYICTTGYVTNVWNVLNGRLLVSLSHGDTVKVTSIAFRPAKDVEDEGKRIWLGTNTGEMHELDIPTQSIAYTKPNAHRGSTVVKIFRYASEMWSLDDDGSLHIWPADELGHPTLQQTPSTFHIPRGHTFSIISGSQLWVAFTKDIRVYSRSGENQHFQQVTPKSISQANVGDVTSGAILSSQPDRIYFGHTDGKVTIYSKKTFECLSVINVSLYKISSLVGVGDYLWAGYSTGMIYVYDTSATPWKVLKDWKAHEKKPIAGILADRTSIWKLDRLQVASLGTDNLLRIWDGMLRNDWLETKMQENDADYCSFREMSVKVMTWNAGAVKPASLRHNEQDQNFFRELLQPEDPPDIMVFGFQELVDLEDKKITAKSFFKKKKSKEASENEHMSHAYRAWRDHLIRTLDDICPRQNYTLLHTANLVGLFTCVFVKASERSKIRDVAAAEIKLGFSGRVGNKGALVVRFFIDDSSLCLINCHLAAGQSQTTHRNNDAAAIMEAQPLPHNRSPSDCANFFVGGGDGSMILDHEICILNGDLNYRIDSMTRDSVISAVRQGNLSKLLDRDQLLLSRKRNPGLRLRAFNEAPITFAPTYKYDVGTDTYDTSEKKRSPAWCDRVLYRGMGRIKQLDYRRHDCVKVSDHRPVSGRFKIRVKTISAKHLEAAKDRHEVEFEAVKRRIAGDIK